ncbi:MAG: hypothetical protein H6563_08725 [Lewinellaceae bacterium]|nr:hypothetical protein [Lewinellaceae bacterium]
MFEFEDFTLIENLTINFGLITISVAGIIFFFIRYPSKFERLVAWIHSILRKLIKQSEYTFVKYNVQSKLNSYIDKARKKAPQIETSRATIEWIDENQTMDNFINNGQLVIRMQRSDNQNRNIVNASMAFISSGYLKKAKSYIAKYQRESIDLFVCYDMLKNEKREILDQFTQDYLKEAMTNEKIGEFFEKFMDIDKAGIFYPIFIQELTFFGEKVFTRKRNQSQVYEQVKNLVMFLYNYANRKQSENTITDFDGLYSKFAIRIVGKSFKINTEGERTYKSNLKKIDKSIETIYLLGNRANKEFIQRIGEECKGMIGFDVLYRKEYSSVIKNKDGGDFEVDNYLMVLRNDKIATVHKN